VIVGLDPRLLDTDGDQWTDDPAGVLADSDSAGAGLPPTISPTVGPSTPDPDPALVEVEALPVDE
jgi:hypothetical protein